MTAWTGAERRWAGALFEAMIPAGEGPLPGMDAIDTAGFWRRFEVAAPGLLRIGLRASVWALTWLPLFHPQLLRPFHRLPASARDAFLGAAADSPFHGLRQLVLVIKLVATLAYFHDTGPRSCFPGAGH